jgi:[glutamine synthetase] adenylyltransferase / [glutamine synthetase]-adenylyl-L-tyrosine phosphorylase
VLGDAEDVQQATLFWQNLQSPQYSETKPEAIGETLWQALLGFAQSGAVQGMSARGRTRLDHVVPLLWSMAVREPHPEPCALRLIDFLSAILGRSAYLALLAEKPAVSKRLVRWFSQSAWIARTLTQTPILLDELLDSRRGRETLLHADTRAALLAEFMPQLLAQRQLDAADTEALFELLVTLRNTVQLRVASEFLAASLDAYRATHIMSATADVILSLVLEHALDHMQAQHGSLGEWPASAPVRYLPGFVVLGYGSLGGEEINFASDLDLVFLFDESLAALESTGPKLLDGQRYCVKLAQRVLTLLSTNTRFGPLYPIDTRLRPNGNKGLLVTSVSAFADYQRKEAWTWEHQALVRARVVAGDALLAQRFAALRQEILQQAREPQALLSDVQQMRERMRAELDRSSTTHFDLKQGEGALVDIEFQLQHAMLAGTLSPALGTRSEVLLASDARFAALRTQHARYLDLSLRATLALAPRVIARAELARLEPASPL